MKAAATYLLAFVGAGVILAVSGRYLLARFRAEDLAGDELEPEAAAA